MTNANLENLIVQHVSGRGRWLHAGNNNVINYLSVVLQCGPNRLAEIREVLLAPSPVLHVEHTQGKIYRIGLASWLQDTAIETEEIPGDLAGAYLRISHLTAELSMLRGSRVDIEAVLEEAAVHEQRALEADGREAELRAQIEEQDGSRGNPGACFISGV